MNGWALVGADKVRGVISVGVCGLAALLLASCGSLPELREEPPAVEQGTEACQMRMFFRDADEDGFGDVADSQHACAAPPGYVEVSTDCDDQAAEIHPSAVEVCSGQDEDCDGQVDDDDSDVDRSTQLAGFLDEDGDGFGDADVPMFACGPRTDWAPDAGDCDDAEAGRHPGAPPSCLFEDANCDGLTDPRHVDTDRDGFSTCEGDCDDTDRLVHGDATEVCGDRLDNDCDGLVDGDDPSADAFSCGWCPSSEGVLGFAHIAYDRYNPCMLDPDAKLLCDPDGFDVESDAERYHRISYRTDGGTPRDALFLFLPPGHGTGNSNIVEWAAYSGYRAVSLGYDNTFVIGDLCDDRPPECFEEVRREVVYGVDRSELLEVGRVDSIEHRLIVLLEHLAGVQPDLGWDSFLDAKRQVRWDRIVAAGWSRAAAHATLLAQDHRLRGLVLISGPQDHFGEEEPLPAAWLHEPFATPGCAMYGLRHTLEWNPMIVPNWDAMSMPALEIDVDDTHPPYDDAHRFTTTVFTPRGDWCTPHSSMAVDDCMNTDLADPYLHIYCRVAEAGECEE